MAIPCRNLLCAAALVGGTTLVTSQVLSVQHEKELDQQTAMMEEWLKLAEPGPQHAEMAKAEGEWHQANTSWMYPGAEPSKSTSTSKLKSVLGGRYIIEKTSGAWEINGEQMPFEGMGIHGFDNAKQKYVFAWIDSMGTMIMTGEGTADESGKVITYYSEMPNPEGGTMRMKSVATKIDNDHQKFEMFMQMPDGSWFRHMEMIQNRK